MQHLLQILNPKSFCIWISSLLNFLKVLEVIFYRITQPNLHLLDIILDCSAKEATEQETSFVAFCDTAFSIWQTSYLEHIFHSCYSGLRCLYKINLGITVMFAHAKYFYKLLATSKSYAFNAKIYFLINIWTVIDDLSQGDSIR